MNDLKQKRNNLQQKRLERELKKGIDISEYLLFLNEKNELIFRKVRIVDKSTEYAKKYIPPKILSEIFPAKYKYANNDCEIYHIIPSTSLTFEFTSLLQLTVYREFEKLKDSMWILEQYQVAGIDIIFNEFTKKIEVIDKFNRGIPNIEPRERTNELPPPITAMPRQKFCLICGSSFWTTNNKQIRCKRCALVEDIAKTKKFFGNPISEHKRNSLLIETDDDTIVSYDEFFKD